jgi:ABC-type dipeptide/oligopeptide/nickel transport system permease component
MFSVVLMAGALIVAMNTMADALRTWMDPQLREVG